jgi:hypothetical protein
MNSNLSYNSVIKIRLCRGLKYYKYVLYLIIVGTALHYKDSSHLIKYAILLFHKFDLKLIFCPSKHD